MRHQAENIFVTEHDGEMFVKVLDFGIAKDEGRSQSITMTGTTLGTPSYMSPEQLFCPKEVDLRSDLWSAAVVAYRCLTGQLPFEGDTFGTMCISVHDGAFAPPSSIDPNLPRELDAWFAQAMS
jgi:serine/threonine-protein kinase